MGKSKSGGTRAYIRGRVGADVYSIGKDAKGAKQQVVRSLAEVVSNPQTIAQMRGRMIMSTVMQAVSGMKAIIDHSFDDVPTGQPSISEFISRNYALVKADVAAHPSGNNRFGLNEYHAKGIVGGRYIVSNGDAVLPAAINFDGSLLTLASLSQNSTIADLKAALGITAEDYLTVLGITSDGTFNYVRLQLNSALADTATISASLANLFIQEGTKTLAFTYTEGEDVYVLSAQAYWANNGSGVIFTKKTADGYVHSTCILSATVFDEACADVVLPSYPVGTEMFLNGGDL